MRIKLAFVVALLSLLFSGSAFAQYTPSAGINAPKVEKKRSVRDSSGIEREEVYYESAPADRWGNAQGNANDLAVDGAFEGQTVAVIQLYQFDFELARAASRHVRKGGMFYLLDGHPRTPFQFSIKARS